jgi:hypothetical protein
MNLAVLKISTATFDRVCDHLFTYRREYGNMHLRDTRIVNGKRTMRYLHMIRAASRDLIEGIVSGSKIFCKYQIQRLANGSIQVNVLSELGDEAEIERFAKRFLKDILDRVALEQEDQRWFPKRSPGEFYLRRGMPGTPISHRTSQLALKNRVLHRPFLELVAAWKFELFVGREKDLPVLDL